MNPYASHLEGRDPFAVIAETPGALADLCRPLDASALGASPAPGKWSIREILAHLADCELVFAFRLRQSVAQEHHTMQPFDQDEWAKHYAWYTAQEALATFRTMRQWNIVFLKSLPEAAFDKPVTHPERGTMTLRTIVETMGGHDRNHVKQVLAIAEKA
jgi:uncharacterized damage-inducible protein DinB